MQIERKGEGRDAHADGAWGALRVARGPLEHLLYFREERARREPVKPRRAQGALSSQLARAARRIERTRQYRRSLRRVLELVSALQAVLEPAQRERWLALEEAFLDHSARLQRAYFRSGLHTGLKRGARQSRAALRKAPSTSLDVEVVLALLRWLRRS